jgi:hypothetical protein
VQLVRFDRRRRPVEMDIGPVLDLEDVIGTKVAAMPVRAEPRDFVDVAAALDRYTREQLIDLGRRADQTVTDEEFVDAMRVSTGSTTRSSGCTHSPPTRSRRCAPDSLTGPAADRDPAASGR